MSRSQTNVGKLFKAIPPTEDMYVYQNNGLTFEDARAGLELLLGLDYNNNDSPNLCAPLFFAFATTVYFCNLK